MSETRYCSECNRKTESGESYGRPYCRECGGFYEPKLLAKRKEMIAEIREWHEGKRDSFPQLTVFEAFGVMLDELDRLEREYADERAAHNAHVTELCELEQERDKLIEGLRWYADAKNYRREFRSRHGTLVEPAEAIYYDGGQRARDILKEIGVTVE